MKTSVKLYVFSALLFIFAIFLITIALKNRSVSTVPFEATVEKAENTDISGYDYFKLSDGFVVPYATVYEIETPGNNVTEIIYPFVSKAYLEKARNAYKLEHENLFSEEGFIEWFQTYKVKPKFYVQAKTEKMGEDTMFTLMLADSLAKNIEGTRITSFVSLSTHISSEYEKQGITTENSVFISEGTNPVQEKEAANVVLILGSIFALVSVILFILGRSSAIKAKKRLQQKNSQI